VSLHKPALVAERPLATTVFQEADDFTVPGDAVYLAARSGEERSKHAIALQQRSPGARFLEVTEQTRSSFRLEDPDLEVGLRSPLALNALWRDVIAGRKCYVDITGLTHSVWAAVILSGLEAGAEVEGVYVEPLTYLENEIADPSRDLFNLTIGFEGLAPLPGLVSFSDPGEEDFWFVPLLGFEGRRFTFMRDHIAPASGHTVPVIGVPGFQPEFVGFAYHGNQEPLLEDDCWQYAAYATANCPFGLFYLLSDLLADGPGRFLKVATIGTKPHSLGAVLFAFAHPDAVEILYDHPLRKPQRTSGHARLLVYHLSAFAGALTAPPTI